MEEESIAKLLQIPRNLFINHRDPTLVTNVYSEKQTFILFSEEFVIRQEGAN